MRLEIDQSVKIEQLNRDTVIGISNSVAFAVSLPSKAKKKLQKEFRSSRQPKLFRYRTFMAAVVLALHYAKLKNIPSIVIDREYAGQEVILRSMFYEMWSLLHEELPPIEIKEIGKRSPAHDMAYLAMKGKRPIDRVLTYREVRQLALR